MNTPQFDFEALFDADYLYFYAPLITAERSYPPNSGQKWTTAANAEEIASLSYKTTF
ncbi:hypothetical protein [Microseira sp. BLCC-F43]|jgi:hypothetical protein|uniref:hypothetical protein n=1 Tax=Microseira sp. BLCC-F43 TaxID=3153602 RepID=UPI0035B9D17F